MHYFFLPVGSVPLVCGFVHAAGQLHRIIVYNCSMRMRMYFACYLYVCVCVFVTVYECMLRVLCNTVCCRRAPRIGQILRFGAIFRHLPWPWTNSVIVKHVLQHICGSWPNRFLHGAATAHTSAELPPQVCCSLLWLLRLGRPMLVLLLSVNQCLSHPISPRTHPALSTLDWQTLRV